MTTNIDRRKFGKFLAGLPLLGLAPPLLKGKENDSSDSEIIIGLDTETGEVFYPGKPNENKEEPKEWVAWEERGFGVGTNDIPICFIRSLEYTTGQAPIEYMWEVGSVVPYPYIVGPTPADSVKIIVEQGFFEIALNFSVVKSRSVDESDSPVIKVLQNGLLVDDFLNLELGSDFSIYAMGSIIRARLVDYRAYSNA